MISIGNDIVDLKAKEPELHPRYSKRVFNPEELEFINSDMMKLWQVWSAKEAVFKCLKRLRSEIIFSPKKFEFNHKRNLVLYEGVDIYCKHLVHESYIHCLAATNPELLAINCISNWIEKGEDIAEKQYTPSELIREITKEKLGNLLKISKSDIEIRQSKYNIPELYIRQKRSADLLSFSHHGSFVAVCYLKL